MVLPGGDHPSELVSERQAALREGLRDPASAARAAEARLVRAQRKERRIARRHRIAGALKRLFTGPG